MARKKIAVVTDRRQTAEFFVLEARSCGCAATVLPTIPDNIKDYDIIVSENKGIEKSVTVKQRDGSVCVWELPVPVSRLRELYMGGEFASGQMREGEDKLFLSPHGEKKAVMLRDKIIPLTDGEWHVLVFLAQRNGEPVSRAELSLLFGAERGNIADVYICRLRKKLEEPFGIKAITTVREKGYALSLKADNVPTEII